MKGSKGRGVEFCCCAIPLINFGSYTICVEFIFTALCTAILALGPTAIVATVEAIPAGWPKFIVFILAMLSLFWQFFGIYTIKKETTSLYRTYIRINLLLTLITIVATLAFFAVAAVRHSSALANCRAQYGNIPAGSTTSFASGSLSDVGTAICNIFLWVQVGFMGLLIALVGLTQLYMCTCQRAYGKEMRQASRDFKSYNSEGIPLANRGSAIWEADTISTSMPTREAEERNFSPDYQGRAASDRSTDSQEDLNDTRTGYGQKQLPPAPYQSYPAYGQPASGHYDQYEQPEYAHQEGQYAYQNDVEPDPRYR